MDGMMALSAWEEDEEANDNVTTSVVVAAHVSTVGETPLSGVTRAPA